MNEDRVCCDSMRLQLTHQCEQHSNDCACPDVLVAYYPRFDEFGIPIRDGGSSISGIAFCPWCGVALPESKRDLWFDTLEQLGNEDPDDTNVPKDFLDDGWWRGRTTD